VLDELNFYKSLFENHPDAILACGVDGRYTLVNEAAEQLTGYTQAQLQQSTLRNLVREEDIPVAYSYYQKAMQGEPQRYELTLRQRGGTCIDIHVTKVPMYVDGRIEGVFNIVKDITARKETERLLRQSEARLLRAQRISQFGSWEWDLRTDALCGSDELHRIYGVEAGTLNSFETFLSCVLEEDRAGVVAACEAAIRGEFLDHQYRIRRPDGSLRTMQVQAEVLLDVNGNPIRMIGTDRDITEKLEQEQCLRRNNELMQLIAENAEDIISYSTLDGVVRYVSPSTRRVLGYEPEELIGTPSLSYYHPDDLEQLPNLKFPDDTDLFTFRVRHKQGHWVLIETTMKLIRDERGEVEKVLGIGRDITARKQAEDQLNATREQLESYFMNNSDAISILDLDWNVVRINPAYEKLFGYPEQEMIGRPISSLPLIPFPEREELGPLHAKIRNGEPVLGYETRRRSADGRLLNVVLTFSPVRNEQNQLFGCSVMVRDITERKRAEELLLQSEKLGIAGQLAAGVAHEIRNPLTALKGFVQLMQVGNINPKYLDVMESELKRIESIVSELLVLAKPQAVAHKPRPLAGILEHVLTLIETQALLKNVQVITDCDAADLPELECDENQLKQVFLNFLQNAIDAMPDGGRVHLRVNRPTRQQVAVSIRDEGVGIPADLLHKLGEPFYTTKEKGTGLGLMVSKRIIEQHAGSLRIDSVVNSGTTIEVRLPCLR
jgi:PAS domain S-box-containing protein